MSRHPSLDRVPKTASLRARLREIESDVRERKLARSDAGDLILKEVLPTLKDQRSEDGREFLCDAALLASTFYEASAAVDPREAATTLLAAADHHRALPANAVREALILRLGRSLETRLRDQSQRRMRCRLLHGLLACRSLDDARPDDLLGDLALLPPALRELADAATEPTVFELLPLVESLRDRPETTRLVHEIRQETGRLALRWGELDQATRLWDVLDSEARQVVMEHVLQGSRLPPTLMPELLALLKADATARERLEPELLRHVHVSARHESDEAMAREGLARELGRLYPDREWPFHAQAVAAARRGDDVLAVAAHLLSRERGDQEVHGLLRIAAAMGALGLSGEGLTLIETTPQSEDDPTLLVLKALARGLTAAEAPAVLGWARYPTVPTGLAVAAFLGLSDVLVEARNFELARRVLADAKTRRPNDRRIGVRQAEVAALAGDVPAAKRHLDAVPVAVAPALPARARLATASGQLEEALQHLAAMIADPAAVLFDRDVAESLTQRYGLLAGAERGSKRLREITKSLRAQSAASKSAVLRHLRAWREEAASLARTLGQSARELEFLLPLAAEKDVNDETLARILRAVLAAGELGRGQELVANLKRRKLSGELRFLMGLLALAQRELDLADEHWAAADAAGYTHLELTVGRAYLAALRGEVHAPLQALNRVLPRGELGEMASDIRASLLEREGDFEQAMVVRRPAAHRSPSTRFAFARLATTIGLRRLAQDGLDAPELAEGIEALDGLSVPEAVALRELAERAQQKRKGAAAKLLLLAASAEVRPEGNPALLADALRKARAWLSDGSEARPFVTAALQKLEHRLAQPSLARLSERVRNGSHSLEELLSEAESLVAKTPSVKARHHLCLLRLRRAYEWSRSGHPSAISESSRLHAEFAAWTAMPGFADHLLDDSVSRAALDQAREEFARELLENHLRAVFESMDKDRAQAEAHARLLLRSGLLPSEREQRRMDLWLGLTSGIDPVCELPKFRNRAAVMLAVDPEHVPALLGVFLAETTALASVLASLADRGPEKPILVALEDGLDRVACAVRAADDEAAMCPEPDLLLALRRWHWAAAAQAAYSRRDWAELRVRMHAAENTAASPENFEPALSAHLLWADPDYDPIAPCRESVRAGDTEGIEAYLQEIHQRAVIDQRFGLARDAIALITEIRGARALGRQEQFDRLLDQSLSSHRYREVLDALGGKVPGSGITKRQRGVRLRALVELHWWDRARAEFAELAGLSNLDEATRRDLAEIGARLEAEALPPRAE